MSQVTTRRDVSTTGGLTTLLERLNAVTLGSLSLSDTLRVLPLVDELADFFESVDSLDATVDYQTLKEAAEVYLRLGESIERMMFSTEAYQDAWRLLVARQGEGAAEGAEQVLFVVDGEIRAEADDLVLRIVLLHGSLNGRSARQLVLAPRWVYEAAATSFVGGNLGFARHGLGIRSAHPSPTPEVLEALVALWSAEGDGPYADLDEALGAALLLTR